MRAGVLAVLLAFGAGQASAHCCGLSWPDPDIPVPDEVRTFIRAECRAAQGPTAEPEAESEAACISAEAYGYRAQVMMLTDENIAETAAERYRVCGGGMGTIGGKYHRRRADCMGIVLEITWRFEFSREAAERTGQHVHFAAATVEAKPDGI